MDDLIYIDPLSMEYPFCILRGHMLQFLKTLEIVFILANSTSPNEMGLCVEFHLGLHCLPKYLFTSIQNVRVNTL